jgi:N-acetylneuraminic acid mutarotase
MKRIYFPVLSMFVLFTLLSCHKNTIPYTESGNWVTRSQLNGPARSEAVGFTIGDTAYLGSGWDGLNTRYNDFWKYDANADNWEQVASMPAGTERSSAIAFSTGGLAYMGTGYDGFNYLTDFYAFDPVANSWTKKSDFAGGARYEAVGFGIGNYGYVGTGFDGSNALKDFYRYDPSSDSWETIDFSGNKRYGAAVMLYQSKAYLVTGINSGTEVSDFWVFDPSLSSSNWTELRHITNYSTDSYDDGYTNIVRDDAAAFVIGIKGYIATGENGVAYTYTWEYDFGSDLWTQKSDFEGPATTGAVGFNVNINGVDRGYVATGRSGPGQAAASDYLREFQPNVVLNPNDN